jgi:hypothetical protein
MRVMTPQKGPLGESTIKTSRNRRSVFYTCLVSRWNYRLYHIGADVNGLEAQERGVVLGETHRFVS